MLNLYRIVVHKLCYHTYSVHGLGSVLSMAVFHHSKAIVASSVTTFTVHSYSPQCHIWKELTNLQEILLPCFEMLQKFKCSVSVAEFPSLSFSFSSYCRWSSYGGRDEDGTRDRAHSSLVAQQLAVRNVRQYQVVTATANSDISSCKRDFLVPS